MTLLKQGRVSQLCVMHQNCHTPLNCLSHLPPPPRNKQVFEEKQKQWVNKLSTNIVAFLWLVYMCTGIHVHVHCCTVYMYMYMYDKGFWEFVKEKYIYILTKMYIWSNVANTEEPAQYIEKSYNSCISSNIFFLISIFTWPLLWHHCIDIFLPIVAPKPLESWNNSSGLCWPFCCSFKTFNPTLIAQGNMIMNHWSSYFKMNN